MTKRNYATSDSLDAADGFDYRVISDLMKLEGKTVGHSTVRNIILRSMEKIAIALMTKYEIKGNARQLAASPGFQKRVALCMHDIINSRQR